MHTHTIKLVRFRVPRILIPHVLVQGGLVGLLALGLLVAAGSTAQAADDDATWTVRTASSVYGADRTSYDYSVDPGGEVTDAIVVANHGSEPLSLAVYAADGFTSESGQLDLVAGAAKSVGVGAWVKSDVDTITVAPGETKDVPFTVTVPDNATPGDYAGGILTSLAQQDQSSNISVDRRLGIRIALRVGGDLTPSLAVENAHLTWSGGLNPFAGGDATVNYTLHNTGNTALSAQQAVTIAGPFGLLPTDATDLKAPPELLPGESWTVSVPFDSAPGLLWLTATASVTPVVVDASGSTTSLAPIAATAAGPAIPWALLVLLIIVALVIVFAVRARARGRARAKAREDARVQKAVERALAEAEEPVSVGK